VTVLRRDKTEVSRGVGGGGEYRKMGRKCLERMTLKCRDVWNAKSCDQQQTMRCHIFVVYLELCASYAADRLDSCWQEDRSTGAVSRCNRHVSALRSTHTISA